jgi:hypothetical protein
MNFDSIAKMVHEYVKNPDISAKESKFTESEVKSQELSVIQTVFTKYDVSGDVISVRIDPMRLWG